MADQLTPEDLALLQEPHLGHLVTLMPDGGPQVTPVWVHTDGTNVTFNTAKGRQKHRNIERNPQVAISVADKANDYRWVAGRGRAEVIEEGADADIDFLAKKYLGADTYPFRTDAETRLIVRIVPEHVTRVQQ